MKRTCRTLLSFAIVFAVVAALAGIAVAQGSRTFLERRIWYVQPDGRTGEAVFWRVILGSQDVTLQREVIGHGRIPVQSHMMFQLVSSGYIEGVGQGLHGRVGAQPTMRITVPGGQPEPVMMDSIAYIFDYGAKVAMRDGRQGAFSMNLEGQPLEFTRFQLTIMTEVNEELRVTSDRLPVTAVAFSQEFLAAARAAPVSELE